MAQLPEELDLVHASVLEVPGPFKTEHPKSTISYQRDGVEVAHCHFCVTIFFTNLPDNLQEGQLAEVDENYLGLGSQVGVWHLFRVDPFE